jgi:hypothetical protein
MMLVKLVNTDSIEEMTGHENWSMSEEMYFSQRFDLLSEQI